MTEKEVYVKAKLIEPSDRNNNGVIELKTTQGHIERAHCSIYDISNNKANTEQILRGLKNKCNRMLEETDSYKNKELIAKIFYEIESTIKFYQ